MKILGISGGFRPGYQDASVCLIENGEVMVAQEEERFSRVKFSPGRLPYVALNELFNQTGLSMKNIDLIAFHGSTWGDDFELKLKEYFIQHFSSCPPINRYHHHDCHAASSFYASEFKSALIFTSDSSGDGVSFQISLGKDKDIHVIKRFNRPNSIGIFYSMITQYCGFTKEQDEYKLMGLSSYGNENAFDFSDVIYLKGDELYLESSYLVPIQDFQASPHKDEMLFSPKFLSKMGDNRRNPTDPFSTFYKDIAASAQAHIEKLMLEIVSIYCEKYEINQICLAGGVALNCVLNQKLMNASFVSEIFVQPASSDAGISMGAAWLAGNEFNIEPKAPKNYYLGNGFSNLEIEESLIKFGLSFEKLENKHQVAAQMIQQGKVIAWFQGKMEFGPRALGNRSILANPCMESMQQKVNEKIKFRESFRPFCPSVLEEDAMIYFEGNQFPAPFMNITYNVKEDFKKIIPAVTHVDGTARIQTVNESQNKDFYKLLKAVKKKIGHGMLLNTSFNIANEPIVQSPREAVASFYGSGLDYLIIGDYKVWKKI